MCMSVTKGRSTGKIDINRLLKMATICAYRLLEAHLHKGKQAYHVMPLLQDLHAQQ